MSSTKRIAQIWKGTNGWFLNRFIHRCGDLKVWFILAIDFYAGIAYEIPLRGRSRRHSQHRIEGFLHFCCCDWYKQMFFFLIFLENQGINMLKMKNPRSPQNREKNHVQRACKMGQTFGRGDSGGFSRSPDILASRRSQRSDHVFFSPMWEPMATKGMDFWPTPNPQNHQRHE